MSFRTGDWIEVKSKEEILRSLDNNGRLNDLPFMPQMFEYCGHKFKVSSRAHKTCDTINGTGGRRLHSTVHLENIRCDGQAYGGCQAACLIFWKEAWLRSALDEALQVTGEAPAQPASETGHSRWSCTEKIVLASTHASEQPIAGGPKYFCQATNLSLFTAPLNWWDVTQYVEDYTSRNITLRKLISGFIYATYYCLSRPGRRNPIGPPFRWLYDRVVSIWGGTPFPRRRGKIPLGQTTPLSTLDLQPGEWVKVKGYDQILASLNRNNKNRGLYFDAEMVPYCGGTYRVRTRVSNFINETNGLMVSLRTPAVILEDVWCQSRYSDRRMFCPRRIYAWWREEWLERAPPPMRLSD